MADPISALDALSHVPGLPADTLAFGKHYFSLPRLDSVPALETLLDTPPYSLMPRVVITEMFGPDDFVIRYFGTAFGELIGKDYTGHTSQESRQVGIDTQFGARAWEALNFPCGYLSRRSMCRKKSPGKMEAVFDFITLTLPLHRRSGPKCMINYHSTPHMAVDKNPISAPEPLGQVIDPICWVDVGSGLPKHAI